MMRLSKGPTLENAEGIFIGNYHETLRSLSPDFLLRTPCTIVGFHKPYHARHWTRRAYTAFHYSRADAFSIETVE